VEPLHGLPHDLGRVRESGLGQGAHSARLRADIVNVTKMAGHANVQTTARYDRRPRGAKRKVVGLLHVLYRKRSYSPRLMRALRALQCYNSSIMRLLP
jgi:hypothetical protein